MNTPRAAATLAVPPQADDHARGAPHASVTVVEYGDFECPSCRLAAPVAGLLLERYPARLRFIYRHFPLEDAHPHALRAAEAAEAAGAQGKFWPMHDQLFEHQGRLHDPDLASYAAAIGLDPVRYGVAMAEHIYLQKVRDSEVGGRRSHLRATPSFFVNGVLCDVSFGLDALHDAVERAMGG